MKIAIQYCNQWNYLPRAASLASQLLEKYGNNIENLSLLPSDGGVFEITKNDILIFSKKKLGRFPEDSEVFDLIEST